MLSNPWWKQHRVGWWTEVVKLKNCWKSYFQIDKCDESGVTGVSTDHLSTSLDANHKNWCCGLYASKTVNCHNIYRGLFTFVGSWSMETMTIYIYKITTQDRENLRTLPQREEKTMLIDIWYNQCRQRTMSDLKKIGCNEYCDVWQSSRHSPCREQLTCVVTLHKLSLCTLVIKAWLIIVTLKKAHYF